MPYKTLYLLLWIITQTTIVLKLQCLLAFSSPRDNICFVFSLWECEENEHD